MLGAYAYLHTHTHTVSLPQYTPPPSNTFYPFFPPSQLLLPPHITPHLYTYTSMNPPLTAPALVHTLQ